MGGKETPKQFSQRDIDRSIEVVWALASRPRIKPGTLDAIELVAARLKEWRDETPNVQEKQTLWGRFFGLFSVDRGNKERFEATHTLSSEPSIPSDTHWQIFHPPHEVGTTYIPKIGGITGVVEHDNYLVLEQKNTHIAPDNYIDSLGRERIIFAICMTDRDSSGDTYHKVVERYLASDEVDEEIDRSVIVFRNAQTGKTYYLQFTPAQDSDMVGITEMEPVTKVK